MTWRLFFVLVTLALSGDALGQYKTVLLPAISGEDAASEHNVTVADGEVLQLFPALEEGWDRNPNVSIEITMSGETATFESRTWHSLEFIAGPAKVRFFAQEIDNRQLLSYKIIANETAPTRQRPVLRQITRRDGGIALWFDVIPGRTYTLYTSSSLAPQDWVPSQEFKPADSELIVSLPFSAEGEDFFKLE